MTGRPRRTVLTAFGAMLTSGCLRLTQESAPGSAQNRAGGSSNPAGGTPTGAGGDGSRSAGPPSSTGTIEFPTGVSRDGVDEGLLFAHTGILDAQSYTVTRREGRGDFTQKRTHEIAGDVALVTTDDGHNGVVTYLEDGEAYKRGRQGDETVYGYSEESNYPTERLSQSRQLRALIRGGSFVADGTESAGGTRYVRIAADDLTDPMPIENQFGEGSIDSFEGRGLVTSDGLIKRLTATIGFTDQTLHLEIETGSIGETSVEKPAWVDQAKERAPTFEVSLTRDDRFIVVAHTGGDPVEVGVDLNVFDPESGVGRHARIAEGIGDGETMYVSKSGRTRLSVSSGSRPDADPPPFEGRPVLLLYAGLELVETRLRSSL